MANEVKTVKSFSLYAGGAKIGSMETADYDLANQGEQHLTDGGGMFTDGKTMSTINANTIVPVDGATSKLKSALVKNKTLTVQVGVVDGDVDAMQMRVRTAKYSADPKTGTLKGQFSFHGFEPESA